MSKKNRRLFPLLHDASYLVLKDMRKALAPIIATAYGTVIDYGAGSQAYRYLLPANIRYRGADFHVNKPDDILLTDERHLPVPDNSADWVLSLQVLEHVVDPAAYIGECFRVLRPSGTLLLSTHGSWPYHPGPKNGDFQRWTKEGLMLLLQRAKFMEVSIEPVCCGWRGLLQQSLVIQDPARHTKSVVRKLLRCVGNSIVNVATEIIDPFWRRYNVQSDIIPVVYVVRAKRPI